MSNIETINAAADAIAKADEAYEAARKEFEAATTAYRAVKGIDPEGTLRDLLKKWGPKAATYFGLPGLGALLPTIAADKGAFSTVTGALGKLLGAFGLSF